mgnify:CR=1 FL=1
MNPPWLWRAGLVVAWGGAVAVLTLQPGDLDPGRLSGLDAGCLVCGSRGAADAVLNVGFFTPLGLALGGSARAVPGAFLVGAAISFVIELAQTAVPGRHGGIADVLWNGTGAALGALLFGLLRRRMRSHPGPTPPLRGAAPWLAGAGIVLLGTGSLAAPAPTPGDYWVLFTPRLGVDPAYDGSVVEARIAGRLVGHGPLDRRPEVRSALERRSWSVTARIVVGTPPRPVLPVVLLGDPAIAGEVVLVGVHRGDVVVRERRRSTELRFDTPDVRLAGALADVPRGDTVSLRIERAGTRLRLAVDEGPFVETGLTVGRGWGFLAYLEGAGEAGRRALDLLWLAMLFVPAGFFAPTGRQAATTAAGAVVLTGVAGWLTPFRAALPAELLASALGVLAGVAALRLARRFLPPAQERVPTPD